ncbi:MAG TPA: hypothetical protein VJ654_12970 [Noviherbaspirillum sp.]|nr:hypothetical protein [Noviherbaspirillum sp.]
MKTNLKLALTAVAASFVLVGCGGGGSSTTTSNTQAPSQSPSVDTSTQLQTSVAAPTYASASQESTFFAALNDFRGKLGLGLLAQNTKLDSAAQNHLAYVMTYSTVDGGTVDMASIDPATGRPRFHIEDSTKAGFTGIQEKDRATYAGYNGVYVGELGSYGLGQGSVNALNLLINTVFHRVGLMTQGVRDIGIAVGGDAAQTMVVESGVLSTVQKNDANYIGVYPANNQTGVPLYAALETPNPYPDITAADYSTKTSAPISISSEASTTLSVTSFTVTENGQSTPLDSRLLVKGTNADTNAYLGSNVAFLVAKTAFKPNTVYNVSFSGTINGAVTSKTWSFTTGS